MTVTIKRQNLSGDWFESTFSNIDEAKIIFEWYCKGPFVQVEMKQQGNPWAVVYNSHLGKTLECYVN